MYSEEQKQDLIDRICNDIALKGLPTYKALDNNKDYPSRPIFYGWIASSQEFFDKYARACEIRDDRDFELLDEFASDKSDCMYIDEKGVERVDSAAVQLKNISVRTKQWTLSKKHPKKYGDKLQVDNISSDKSEGTQKLLASCSPKALDQIKKIIKYGEILSIENGVEVYNKSLPE